MVERIQPSYSSMLLASAMHGGEVPDDPRTTVDNWLGGVEKDVPDRALREALGV